MLYRVLLCASAVFVLVAVAFFAPSAMTQSTTAASFEAETMTLSPTSAGGASSSSSANGGQVLFMRSNSTATKLVSLSSGADKVAVRARGERCGGAPQMVVRLNGTQVMSQNVSATSFTDYTVTLPSAVSGTAEVEIVYNNDYSFSWYGYTCDRNLLLDKVTLSGSSTSPAPNPPSGMNPFENETLYLNTSYSPARKTADEWYAAGRTEDAKQMEKIAKTASSGWFSQIQTGDRGYQAYVDRATAAGQLPILTLYAIPYRDCGSYSAGGLPASEYRSFIDSVATAIGSRKAVVVVEPDALPGMDCLSTELQEERLELIRYAVDKLKANPQTYVYLVSGGLYWHSAATNQDRLIKANIAKADGFSLNVAGFYYTSDMTNQGKEVSAGVGNKPFLIDTGRGGNGPYSGTHSGDCPSWANPPGRALSERAGYVQPTDPLVHAYVWIKPPGESDADCGGYPPAGTWLPEYALELAKNARWGV